jgi:hypothetical protein
VKIARPASGFIIKLTPAAKATLDGVIETTPRIADVWAGICDRMKLTAHREGEPLPNGGLVIQFPGYPAYGIPKVAVCFRVLGDTLTVDRILIQLLKPPSFTGSSSDD